MTSVYTGAWREKKLWTLCAIAFSPSTHFFVPSIRHPEEQ